jgi:hypothetical protein
MFASGIARVERVERYVGSEIGMQVFRPSLPPANWTRMSVLLLFGSTT